MTKNIWDYFLSEKRLRKHEGYLKNEKMTFDQRNSYESDFNRCVFSSACRRLHDKTQVFPLSKNDNVHSRLTHSLEVMNVGESFAIDLSRNDNFKKHTKLSEMDILRKINPILKASCLVHDIGNPPFGHFGEKIIQGYFTRLFQSLEYDLHNDTDKSISLLSPSSLIYNCAKREDKLHEIKNLIDKQHNLIFDYIQFDGNAEGFRILTKLQYLGDLYGLNLTVATLASSLKYPNFGMKVPSGNYVGLHKHGIFTTEKNRYKAVISKCHLLVIDKVIRRHPLSFLVEAADSICYIVMDLEDAISKNWIDPQQLLECIENLHGEDEKEIVACLDKIKLDRKANKKEIIKLRNIIIALLVNTALEVFTKNLVSIEKGEYVFELLKDPYNRTHELVDKLQQFEKEYILEHREIETLELAGNAVITGLFDRLLNLFFNTNEEFRSRGKRFVSKTIVECVMEEHNQTHHESLKYDTLDLNDLSIEERLRIIRDYVVGMTDNFALEQYRKLNGQKVY